MDVSSIHAHDIAVDVKAEVIAADLVDLGVDIDDVVIVPNGLFERVFRKDIIKIEQRTDKLGLKDLMFIDVSREGIYNSLPEALFHFFDKEKKSNSAAFIEEYKRHKAEEDSAKLFFLATEKELYRLRVINEMGERRSMLGFTDQFKSELFLTLWPELGDLSDKYLPAMLTLLPVSHRVIGNIKLAQILLSYTLDEHVTINFDDRTRAVANDTRHNLLGHNYLGTDVVIGEVVPDFTPMIEIVIGPVKKGNLMGLMPGGEVRKVLDLACKYVFPVNTDIKISISLDIVDEKLILSDDYADGKLGFTSRL